MLFVFLFYGLWLCEGWCCGGDREEYLRRLDQAAMILNGESEELIASMREKMMKASDELNFEYAAVLRDRIRDIESLQNKERVTSGWAERNLERHDTEDNETKYRKTLATVELLGTTLGLDKAPRTIEAFDVSNLGDTGIVAAMT